MPFFERAARPSRLLGLGFVGLTTAFWGLGIAFPTLEVQGRLLGIPFGSERRSVLGLIANLWESNPFLAMLLILFSLAIPVAKLGLTGLMLWREDLAGHRVLGPLVHHIGRWSMVDVFSMAIVVSFISFNQIRIRIFSTKGHLRVGFYFFLAYCLLSIASTYFLKKTNLTPETP